MGLWTQLGVVDTYPFSNSEKYLINSVNKLEEKDLFDVHILYNNQLAVLKLSAEIRGIDVIKVEEAYNLLPIHDKNDIVVNYQDITNLLKNEDSSKINDVIRDIEHLILSKKIENKKDILIDYILRKYN